MVLAVGCEGMLQNKQADFSISVFGRFAYTLSALNEHCPYKEFIAVCFFRQCSFISYRAFANSRTHDIGKIGLLILQHPIYFCVLFVSICLIINSAYCQLSVLDSKGNAWRTIFIVHSKASHTGT